MKQLKLYSQQDSLWSKQRLGTMNGVTIGSDGCYITSLAMISCYFGHSTTPAKLDDLFTDNHIYYNSQGTHDDPAGLITDGDLTKIFPDITYSGVDHYENTPADLNKLKQYMQDPTIMVVLCIDMGGGNVHFVVCVDCVECVDRYDSIVTIANPWTGQVEPFSNLYGDAKTNILKFVVYKGTPHTQSAGANMYGGLDLNNPESMKPCVDLFNQWKNGQLIAKIDVQKQIDDAVKVKTATLEQANKELATSNETYKQFREKIIEILKPKTNSDADILGAIDGLLETEDKVITANELVENMKTDHENEIKGYEEQITELKKQIDDLKIAHQKEITDMQTKHEREIEILDGKIKGVQTQVSNSIDKKQIMSIFDKAIKKIMDNFKKK